MEIADSPHCWRERGWFGVPSRSGRDTKHLVSLYLFSGFSRMGVSLFLHGALPPQDALQLLFHHCTRALIYIPLSSVIIITTH